MNEEIYSCIQMSCEKKIMTFSIKRFFFPYFLTIATPFLSEFKEEEGRILLRKFLTTFYCCVYWQLAHTSSKKKIPLRTFFEFWRFLISWLDSADLPIRSLIKVTSKNRLLKIGSITTTPNIHTKFWGSNESEIILKILPKQITTPEKTWN